MHEIAHGKPPTFENVPLVAIPLFEKLLVRDKDKRFQTAEDLRRAIAELRTSSGMRVLPLKVRTSARHRPRVVRASIALAVLMVIALGITGAQLWRSRSVSAPLASVPKAPAAETFEPPRTAHDHVQRGDTLLATPWRKGYLDKAVEEYQRAIAIDARHAKAHAGLAMAYRRKYDADKDKAWLELARKNARHAVELDPQLAAAHVALGAAELQSGDVEAARKELAQTLLIDPNNAAAHRWIADIAARDKDARTAEAEFRKAIALQPDDSELHNALGSFLYKSGRYEEAAAQFRRVSALSPDRPSAYRNLGGALHMLGDYAGAARALQQGLEIQPDAAGYSNLGTLYFFQGLYPQSVSAFEKAVELGANDHLVWANLGDAYRWTPGHQAKAREAFTAALRLLDEDLRENPTDATLQSRRALVLAKQGNARGALDTADGLIANKEKDPQNLYRLAVAFELAGARSKSLAALQSALRNGYSTEEVKVDPELASLRRDVQYQRMMVASATR